MCDCQVIYTTPLKDRRVCTEAGLWGYPMYLNEELNNHHWRAYYQGESLDDCFKHLRDNLHISKDEYKYCVKEYCK
jgi:hypothetical protein